MNTRSALCGASGAAAGPNSIAAPLPFAHQCSGSTPLEKNTTPKRKGGWPGFRADVPATVWPKAGSDSSQGSASVTPSPRRKCRRVVRFD